jgi:hypothetical protein
VVSVEREPFDELADGRWRIRLRYLGPDRRLPGPGPSEVGIRRDFRGPIELVLGGHDHRRRCLLLRGEAAQEFGAEYAVVQPDIPGSSAVTFRSGDASRLTLGRSESPELDLGREVSRDHVDIWLGASAIWIRDASCNGTDVLAPEDDLVTWRR